MDKVELSTAPYMKVSSARRYGARVRHSVRHGFDGPVEGMRWRVLLGNASYECCLQLGLRGKVHEAQPLALKHRKPLRYVGQPRTMHRREVQDKPRV